MPTPKSLPDLARTTDRELIARIAEADADAFEELYRRHADHAFMLARKLCASRELAEEVTQESFIALWRSAGRYRPALGSVSVWLASIVRNRAIDAWRRAAVRPVETPVIDDGPGQLHTAIGAETPAPERAVVLSLIGELPAPQKEAVFLVVLRRHDARRDRRLVARAARDGEGSHPDGPAEDPCRARRGRAGAGRASPGVRAAPARLSWSSTPAAGAAMHGLTVVARRRRREARGPLTCSPSSDPRGVTFKTSTCWTLCT